MLKLLAAIVCGAATASTVAYFSIRPAPQRAADLDLTKKAWTGLWDGLRNYWTELIQPKPDVPPTIS